VYRHDYQRLWHRFDRFGPGGPSPYEVLRDPGSSVNQIFYDLLTGATSSDPNVRSSRLVMANNDRTFVSQGAQSVLVFEAEKGKLRHRVEAGLRVHYDQIRRDHTAESYLMVDQTLVRDGSPLERERDERAGALAVAGHAMYALEVGRFRITPGLRTELIRTIYDDYATGASETGFQHAVLGGLGANVALVPWLSAFAGVHRGFSPVAPGQRAEVDPESSVNLEAGFRAFDAKRGLRAELAGFVNDYSNLLLTCAGSGGCAPEDVGRQFNAGAVLVGGLEASVAYDIALGEKVSLPVRGTYSLMKSRFLSSFTSGDPQYLDVREGDEVPYMPRQQGVFEAGLEHPRFGVRATATVVGHMREQASAGNEGVFTDRYAIVDAMGEVHLSDRVSLTVRVENLTNARPLVAHRPFGARPYRPLMAMGGLRVDL
jgi:Fe(3+) dicitrate transport protein